MFNATSAPAGGVILDRRHAQVGPLAPCVLCGLPALCRSPVKDTPATNAKTWITSHATSPTHLTQLIAAYSTRPRTGARDGHPRQRPVPRHLPPAHLPRLRVGRHHLRRSRIRWAAATARQFPPPGLAPALAASGLDIHFHDLRHTGNALVAEAGANLRELMERMGHSTSRAALIYLHSTSERQHMLADAVAARVQSELGTAAEEA
jgi:integrase